jgi:hypothetical protein
MLGSHAACKRPLWVALLNDEDFDWLVQFTLARLFAVMLVSVYISRSLSVR